MFTFLVKLKRKKQVDKQPFVRNLSRNGHV